LKVEGVAMKFKLDENIPFSLKKHIESKGDHQVDSVFHEKKTGIDDHSLLESCLQEQRILITLDTDFNNPVMHPRDSLYGIIILRPHTQGKKAVNSLFTHFLNSYELDKTIKKVLLVEVESISIRWDFI
jgi:predicted nuclease of predicted toxin-antitoxin system